MGIGRHASDSTELLVDLEDVAESRHFRLAFNIPDEICEDGVISRLCFEPGFVSTLDNLLRSHGLVRIRSVESVRFLLHLAVGLRLRLIRKVRLGRMIPVVPDLLNLLGKVVRDTVRLLSKLVLRLGVLSLIQRLHSRVSFSFDNVDRERPLLRQSMLRIVGVDARLLEVLLWVLSISPLLPRDITVHSGSFGLMVSTGILEAYRLISLVHVLLSLIDGLVAPSGLVGLLLVPRGFLLLDKILSEEGLLPFQVSLTL